jgi:hypothetical protein
MLVGDEWQGYPRSLRGLQQIIESSANTLDYAVYEKWGFFYVLA